jgi:hypothetical protein
MKVEAELSFLEGSSCRSNHDSLRARVQDQDPAVVVPVFG